VPSTFKIVLVTSPSINPETVGPVPNTATPVPVSSVRTARKFALLGVPSHVATPDARPDVMRDRLRLRFEFRNVRIELNGAVVSGVLELHP
jgi:hypothetical protein